jgi:hypothetical protein
VFGGRLEYGRLKWWVLSPCSSSRLHRREMQLDHSSLAAGLVPAFSGNRQVIVKVLISSILCLPLPPPAYVAGAVREAGTR